MLHARQDLSEQASGPDLMAGKHWRVARGVPDDRVQERDETESVRRIPREQRPQGTPQQQLGAKHGWNTT